MEGFISSMSSDSPGLTIACLIPDRGDRPAFMENCLRMLEKQTMKPKIIEIVDEKPLSDACDITYRYKKGYENLRNKGIDVIFLIENDDFYAADYIETCINEWIKAGKPDLFGQTYTYYYHLSLFAYFKMEHFQRSSAMNTMIKADLNFTWGEDSDPYADAWLWYHLKDKKLFTSKNIICMGMKHGIGLCGGRNHTDFLDRFVYDDKNLEFLSKVVDKESLPFYAMLLTSAG